jgi:hypothetical protein
MALVLSGSIDISGSMTATTILISSPGAAGMVSSSAQITELAPLMAYTASLKGAAIVSSSQQITNYFTFAKTGSANTFYGNQSVSGSLTVNSTGASGISIISSGDSPTLNFTQLALANGGARNWRLIPNYEAWGTLDIQVSADNATLPSTTTRVSMTAAGDVNIKAGNLVMGTSGKGIDFSATANSAGTMTSELLNDYEEGTWTPVLTDLTNDATMDLTYTRGSYIKIGRQVTVRGYILTTSVSSLSANVKIKGLPFTNGSGFANLGGGSIGTASGLNITAGHSVHLSTPIAGNHLGLNVGDDATGTTEMTPAEWSSDGQVQFLATYFVD